MYIQLKYIAICMVFSCKQIPYIHRAKSSGLESYPMLSPTSKSYCF